MINDICCESPRIIRNPDLLRLLMIHKHYVCGDFDTYISDVKLFELQNKGFDKSFSPKYLGVNKDNINDFGVVTGDGTILPMFFIVPCGKCAICRQNKAMEWSTRCAAESASAFDVPLFFTLTYNDKHLPHTLNGNPTLCKKDIQDFMKRLRRRLHYDGLNPEGLRYFIVGEYGHNYHRPHYHGLVWNFPKLDGDNPLQVLRNKIEYIRAAWHAGYIMCNYAHDLNGSYCMKYMRKPSNCPYEDSQKEFFLSSRKGGSLGALWLNDNKQFYLDNPQLNHITITDHDGNVKDYPMPTYFKRKLFPTLSNLISIDVRKAISKCLFAYQQIINIRPFFHGASSKFFTMSPKLDVMCFFLNKYGITPPSLENIDVQTYSHTYKDAARFFKLSSIKLADMYGHYWNIFESNFNILEDFYVKTDFKKIDYYLEISAIHKEFVDRAIENSIKKETVDRLYQIENNLAKSLIKEIF